MLLEALFSAIAEAVFGYLLQQSGPAERVRAVLGLDPQHRAFQTALARAYADFARQHPEWTASLFDETFLKSQAVVPLLADLLTGLEAELARQEALQPLYDSRALERIAGNTEAIRRALEEEWQKALAEAISVTVTASGDRSVAVGGNVTGSTIITGEHIVLQLSPERSAPTPPPGPIRTRIPEPRAVRLIGRQEELDWLCRRLRCGDVAAIAGVRGIGGIGKTELAIAAARALEGAFAGGVIWLEGGPNDAYAIQARLAAALGVTLQSDDLHRRADQIAMACRSLPPTLVVLDDLRRRHLADLTAITPPRPPCALLITSRRSDLPLPGAAVRELDPLTPAQSGDLLADLLPPGMAEAEPQAAAEVAKLLENIPLALTLAARRAERIAGRRDAGARCPLGALAEELRRRRLAVLDQGERPDLSVRLAFDASTDDLAAADQARLCRLGVFARNEFDLPAVAAVWEEDGEAARRALGRLADAGLVEEVEEETWWMHDLLREYAAARLEEAGAAEADAARLAHARCWQRYLEETDPRSVEDWQQLAARRPEVERAADWLLGDWPRAPELAAELAVAISTTYEPYVWPQWETWLTNGLAAAEAAGQRNSARRLQRGLSAYYVHCGQIGRAMELLDASLATAREILENAATEEEREAGQWGVAVTLGDIARLKAQGGDVAGALALHQEELVVYEQLGDVRARAVTLGDIARLKAQGGDVAGALALHQEELAVYEQLGDVRSRALTLYDLAGLYQTQGGYSEAERLYRESLEICRQLGDVEGVSAVLARLGQLALAQGRRDQAVALLREARQGFARLGFARWLAHVDELLAWAQGQALTLDDLLAMIRAARQGDDQAGQQAWAICEGLARASDAALAALGRALQDILAGIPPESALAALPADLRDHILAQVAQGTAQD